jgi:hypothetical protein
MKPKPTSRYTYVPSAPVRHRARTLIAEGWTSAGIAKATGFTESGIVGVIKGKFDRCRTKTADAIMALPTTPPRPARFGKIDAIEATDHVLYLIDHGMTRLAISRAAAVSASTIQDLAAGKRQWISEDANTAILNVEPPATLPPMDPGTITGTTLHAAVPVTSDTRHREALGAARIILNAAAHQHHVTINLDQVTIEYRDLGDRGMQATANAPITGHAITPTFQAPEQAAA